MEFSLIERIAAITRMPRADVPLGIGDDAALGMVPPGYALAIAIDTLVEGVHFPTGTAPADLGWKALAVNLSDLAAMGAEPAWALLALTLPTADADFVEGFAQGFAALAAPHRLALVGGDTTRGPLTLSVAVHGFVPTGQALRRDGARIGDLVYVTGTLGDAAAGLEMARRRPLRAWRADEAPAILLARLNRPTPRVAAGLALRGIASACVDVSDGLVADLGHLCTRSGVGAEIEVARLPLSPALREEYTAADALAAALGGGDDYELCCSVPPEHVAALETRAAALDCALTRIGRITEGGGVTLRAADGSVLHPTRGGWEHFA